MEAKFTPSPWVDGNVSDAIVSKLPIADDATESQVEAYRYYGGECICESVEPKNKAIIKASPLLYEALENQLIWWRAIATAIDGEGDVNATMEAAVKLINRALRAARGEK